MSHEHTRRWGMWGFSRTESGCWSIVYDQQSKNVALGTWFTSTVVTIMCLGILRGPSPPATVRFHGKSSRFVGIFFLLQNWHFFKRKNKHRGNDVENIYVKEKKWYLPPHHCTTQHLCTFAIGLPAPAAIRKDRNTGCSKSGKNRRYTFEIQTGFFFFFTVSSKHNRNSSITGNKRCSNFLD